ncbi:MAG: hypothetical protein ACRYGK_08765 [Janthinobacterium lividum]
MEPPQQADEAACETNALADTDNQNYFRANAAYIRKMVEVGAAKGFTVR